MLIELKDRTDTISDFNLQLNVYRYCLPDMECTIGLVLSCAIRKLTSSLCSPENGQHLR